MSAVDDTESPIVTENVLLVNDNLNQLNAKPEIPTHCLRCSIRIAWSTVSKAGLRSKMMKTEHCPVCVVWWRSQLH